MKLEASIMKFLIKINFSEIRHKNLVGFLGTRPNFWTAIHDMLKMTVLPLIQHDFRKNSRVLRLLGGFCVKWQATS